MTFLSDVKRDILTALRDGPLDIYQLARLTGPAPYVVKLELRGLKREQLVAFDFESHRVAWRLTDRGWKIATAADQLTLVEEIAP